MKKALKIIGIILLVLVLLFAAYVAYVLIRYHRIGSHLLHQGDILLIIHL